MKPIKLIIIFLGSACVALLVIFGSQNGKEGKDVMDLGSMFSLTFFVSAVITFISSRFIKE